VEGLEKQIELLKECAKRTDDLNHRIVRAFKVQTIVFTVGIVLVMVAALVYASATSENIARIIWDGGVR
jgi:hypothetical protein